MLDFIVQMRTYQGHRQGDSDRIVVYESEPSICLKHFTQIKHRGKTSIQDKPWQKCGLQVI